MKSESEDEQKARFEAQSRYQQEFYDSHDADYLEPGRNIPYARYIVDKIRNTASLEGKTVFEVGAGQGRFTFEMARYAGQIVASDISKREIDVLNRKVAEWGIGNVTGRVHNLMDASDAHDRSVDIVVGCFILHHLPIESLRQVGAGLGRMLRPGGTMIFVENNPTSPMHLLAIATRRDMTWELEKGTYTPYIREWRNACAAADCETTLERKFGFFPPEFINRMPGIIRLHPLFETLPVVRDLACPFILVAAVKRG